MADSSVKKGIYSSTHSTPLIAGMTRRAAKVKRFWAVQTEDDGSFSIQPLNQNLIPTGQKRPITTTELSARFTFEPDYFVEQGTKALWRPGPEGQPSAPAADPADTSLLPLQLKDIPDLSPPGQAGKVSLDRTPLGDGEDEMAALLQRRKDVQDKKRQAAEDQAEQRARAEFVLGVAHLKRGDRIKALQLFEKVATMDGEFAPRHKHMFNEFGIGLRKNNLPDMALKMYRRTLELSPNDDHIYHNMARIHYERGEVAKATELLQKSLELNPGLEMSRKFLDFIEKNRKKFPRFSL
ncbi:tetratricopeptide repeat protein [Megalodesulfovibrio gigas]|uniref:Uncharacterized protein n=1 Tax=Megalodesulfovibrio gigas (strain ATCC 19364 / DSM 1382 / NCIMB 9332 / VKM B-1759) TaxID=1121448 RepID=T2GDM0_MEGG1|nr:tetratricopeptide repeat protein [Megalodesulfovibrio gigas]AGW14002.1 hypothetical protein DGI_2247 [Megalodesulfovibrio gigas DSM 1382 = ATCC 19364]